MISLLRTIDYIGSLRAKMTKMETEKRIRVVGKRTKNIKNKKRNHFKNKQQILKKKIKRGSGIIDRIIDKLPIELHIPGYQYCGPGMKNIILWKFQ